MAILNYTTKIKPERSVAEIQKKLAAFGASSIMVDYEDGTPSSLSFNISAIYKGEAMNMAYRLPVNAEGVLEALKNAKVQRSYQTIEHARSVAWRILKDWVESQLAIIEAGLAAPAQVLLPYAIAPDNRTLFDHFAENPQKLLSA